MKIEARASALLLLAAEQRTVGCIGLYDRRGSVWDVRGAKLPAHMSGLNA